VSDSEGRVALAGDPPLSFELGCAEPSGPIRRSTIGRPRVLTDRQVEAILAEHARFLAWRALRQTVKSQRQLAREFGVSQGTISLAVRSKGQYKQLSPERCAVKAKRRRNTAARVGTKGLR
jgi:hypothetical protein